MGGGVPVRKGHLVSAEKESGKDGCAGAGGSLVPQPPGITTVDPLLRSGLRLGLPGQQALWGRGHGTEARTARSPPCSQPATTDPRPSLIIGEEGGGVCFPQKPMRAVAPRWPGFLGLEIFN